MTRVIGDKVFFQFQIQGPEWFYGPTRLFHLFLSQLVWRKALPGCPQAKPGFFMRHLSKAQTISDERLKGILH